MPKKKTKKSIAKRVKVTKKGKVLRRKSGTSHRMTKKKKKRKRRLKRPKVETGKRARRLKRLLTE